MRCLNTLARYYVRLYSPCEDLRQGKSRSLERTSADVMGWDGIGGSGMTGILEQTNFYLHFIAEERKP